MIFLIFIFDFPLFLLSPRYSMFMKNLSEPFWTSPQYCYWNLHVLTCSLKMLAYYSLQIVLFYSIFRCFIYFWLSYCRWLIIWDQIKGAPLFSPYFELKNAQADEICSLDDSFYFLLFFFVTSSKLTRLSLQSLSH